MDFDGKVIFISGGAGGLGLNLAKRMLQRGAQVMLGDVDEATLAAVAGALPKDSVGTVVCDMSDGASIQAAAEATLARFGKVNGIVNNAGVGAGGRLLEQTPGDFKWVVDVNLMGVVDGCRTFLPHMEATGEAGMIINIASMAGWISLGGMSAYAVSKFGVVALSEALRSELQDSPIDVAVVCPGFVQTRIHESERVRPERYGAATEGDPEIRALMDAFVTNGLPLEEAGLRIMAGLEAGEFYVFTHPEMAEAIEARHREAMAAYHRAAQRAGVSVEASESA